MAGYMLNMESPSVTNILKAGHPVMALSGLLYGPTTVNQVKMYFIILLYTNSPITYMSSARGLCELLQKKSHHTPMHHLSIVIECLLTNLQLVGGH